MSRKIKIILADDHTLVRKGFISLLKKDPKISITGEAENGRELLDLLKFSDTDIILLDLDMPVMNGAEAMSVIQGRYPHLKVIILSSHCCQTSVAEYMKKGASAYLSKKIHPDTLLDAIYSVFENGRYFDFESSNAILNSLQNESISIKLTRKCLSARETEILKLLCDHKTSKEIASLLNVTERTIIFHRQNLYKKTNCKRLTELIMYAMDQGLIRINQNHQVKVSWL
jgi:DNA-binding NarL/FixJ family response regulator